MEVDETKIKVEVEEEVPENDEYQTFIIDEIYDPPALKQEELIIDDVHDDSGNVYGCTLYENTFFEPFVEEAKSDISEENKLKKFLEITVSEKDNRLEIKLSIKRQHETTFECEYCLTMFPSFKSLESHISEFHRENTFNCLKCRKCVTISKILHHKAASHKKTQTLLFESVNLIENGKIQWGYYFSFKKDCIFIKIDKLAMETQPHWCNLCKKKFSKKNLAENHLRKVHPFKGRVKCVICEDSTMDSTFFYHSFVHDAQNIVEFRALTLSKSYIFNGNQLSVCKASTKKLECGKCKLSFLQYSKFEMHMYFEHSVLAFKCFICSIYMNLNALEFHISKRHPMEDLNVFKFKPTVQKDKIIKMDSLSDIYIFRLSSSTNKTTYFLEKCKRLGNHDLRFCQICVLNFETFEDLENHIGSKHESGYYSCSNCCENILTIKDIHHHILTHKEAQKLTMQSSVGVVFSLSYEKDHFYASITEVYSEEAGKNVCRSCKTVDLNFNDHLKKHNFGFAICTICSENVQVMKLREHIYEDHNTDNHLAFSKFLCVPETHQQFMVITVKSYRRELLLTVSEVYKKVAPMPVCGICKELLKDDLAIHMKNVHSIEYAKCSVCSEKLKITDLKTHTLMNHLKAGNLTHITFKCITKDIPKVIIKDKPKKKHTKFTFGEVRKLMASPGNGKTLFCLNVSASDFLDYECNSCDISFEKLEDFQDHIEENHFIFHPLKCFSCSESIALKNFEQFQSHMELNNHTFFLPTFHKPDQTLNVKNYPVQRWIFSLGYVKDFSIGCSKALSDFKILRLRKANQNSKQYSKCYLCNIDFPTANNFLQHLYEDHFKEDFYYVCTGCKTALRVNEHLNHMKSLHQTLDSLDFLADVCNSSKKSSEMLNSIPQIFETLQSSKINVDQDKIGRSEEVLEELCIDISGEEDCSEVILEELISEIIGEEDCSEVIEDEDCSEVIEDKDCSEVIVEEKVPENIDEDCSVVIVEEKVPENIEDEDCTVVEVIKDKDTTVSNEEDVIIIDGLSEEEVESEIEDDNFICNIGFLKTCDEVLKKRPCVEFCKNGIPSSLKLRNFCFICLIRIRDPMNHMSKNHETLKFFCCECIKLVDYADFETHCAKHKDLRIFRYISEDYANLGKTKDSSSYQCESEIIPLQISFYADGSGYFLKAAPFDDKETESPRFACSFAKHKKDVFQDFENLIIHIKSTHLKQLELKWVCSLCKDLKEVQAKTHFLKHLIDDNIKSCKLLLDQPNGVNSSDKITELHFIVVEHVQDKFYFCCTICGGLHKSLSIYLKHLVDGHAMSTNYDDLKNVQCEECSLLVGQCNNIICHVQEHHFRMARVQFKIIPFSNSESSISNEPESKKMKC